jgi:hypothetical protein
MHTRLKHDGGLTGSTGAITITVPQGKVPDYSNAWGVSAVTVAGGNTTKYGSSHKAVTIEAAS